VLAQFDQAPLVLPEGAATRIVDLQAEVHQRRAEGALLHHHLESAKVDLVKLREMAEEANRAHMLIATSRWWRLTALPRRVTHFLRHRLLRRGAG
jgi:hypothetical protein